MKALRWSMPFRDESIEGRPLTWYIYQYSGTFNNETRKLFRLATFGNKSRGISKTNPFFLVDGGESDGESE